MKRLMSAALAAVLLVAGTASAGDGWAVGISAARADIDVNDVGINMNGEATGWRLFGLYKFTEKFSIEGGVSTFDDPDDPTIPSSYETETESFDLFAVGTWPVTDRLDLFGKAGVVQWNAELEESEENEVSTSSTNLALGFGGEFQLNARMAIRGEYQWSGSKNTGAGNMYALGAVFLFQ